MRTITSAILLASAASLLALSACKGDNKAAPESAKPVTVATVNGTAITESTVSLIAKQRGGQGDSPEARKAIIENLTLQLAIAQEAMKQGLDKTPAFAEQMDAVKHSLLANAYVEDFIKKNPVTDDMLKAEYERIKAEASGTEYKARHILVEKEADAKAIIATLMKTPAAFAKLATEKSKDTGSKAGGGDLGWFDVRNMVPEFGAALGKMSKGQVSEVPVKTQFGFHVIMLEDSRPIAPPALEEVKLQLSQQIQQKTVRKQLDALKAAAKIDVVGAAPAASAAASAPASQAAK